MIEILINEQPKHESVVYAVGVASPFSSAAAHRRKMRERSSPDVFYPSLSIPPRLNASSPVRVSITTTPQAASVTTARVSSALPMEERRGTNDLRHTFATRLLERGVHHYVISALLGHATPMTGFGAASRMTPAALVQRTQTPDLETASFTRSCMG